MRSIAHESHSQEVHGERRRPTPQSCFDARHGVRGAGGDRRGRTASAADGAYIEAGATIAESAERVWSESDIVVKVRAPEVHPALGKHEADMLREGATLISFIWPAQSKELLDRLAARRATALAMDCVPRITRAQKLDALSAMANLAGHRAIVGAHHYPSLFTGQVTAAEIDPAKVLVIGAGVAGWRRSGRRADWRSW